jgi:hypothetical protein
VGNSSGGAVALSIDDQGGMEMTNRKNKLSRWYGNVCTRLFLFAEHPASMLMMLAGIGLLLAGLSDPSIAQQACSDGSCSDGQFADDLIRSEVG